MFVVDDIGDHIVETYVSTGLVTTLYVGSNVSLCLSYLVEESVTLDLLDVVI